jgi:enoyl-CoA hydratase/carnithine racemase
MSENTLLIEKSHQNRVAHLVLNTPENLNAMSLGMAQAFRDAGDQLADLPDLRAVVIRGNGRAFSAGGDLKMLRLKADNSIPQNRREMLWFYRSFLGLRDLLVPLVCALHGHVVGAGFCFSAACDVRIADKTALFSAPFTRLALHPGMGGSYFLPLNLGRSVANDLMLTGRRMNGQEAADHGFVTGLAELGELSELLEKTLERLLKSAPLATRALLQSQRLRQQDELERTLEGEATEQAQCYARPEFVAGVEALMKKEPPPWSPTK